MRWILGLIGALALSASVGCACDQYCNSLCACDDYGAEFLGMDCKGWCNLSVEGLTESDCQLLLDSFNAEGGCDWDGE